jgi:hypothetical protein
MVLDMIRVLKGVRALMPKLSREDFLQMFMKGGNYVKP